MKFRIFAVRDIATDQYANPMFFMTKGQAIRAFTDEVNRDDKDNMLAKHPTDFELYELGEYDGDTGLFETNTPKQVVTAKEVKVPK